MCIINIAPVNGVRCYACTGNANITKGCIDPIDPNAPGVRIVDNCLGKCYTRYAEGGTIFIDHVISNVLFLAFLKEI